ncbi:hypothetical protein SAMN02787076_04380 [Rhizobacter sp. OV335]|nr:hypothetical protein SAMN02787076_04380 [Rhizobacter sp. OV335]
MTFLLHPTMPYAIELKALVPSQLAKVERENRPVAVAVKVLRQVPIFGDRLLAHYFNRTSKRLAQHAVWFRGARSRVTDDKSESLIDADFDLCDSLDRFADRLQVLRAGLLGVQTMVRQGHCALTLDAVKVLLRTSAELFEEIQAFKTEMMEHDADRAPRDEGWTASTPEEVRKLFARL